MSLDIPDPENELQRKMLSAAVREAVLALPDRELFLRFYFYYQTVEQISRELGINPSTVKTKLRRGREALKRALSDVVHDIRRL